MDVDKIRELREELEYNVYKIIKEFELETDTYVNFIELDRGLVANDEGEILCNVFIDVGV